MSNAQVESLGKAVVVVGRDAVMAKAQVAYVHIPADELRAFVDGLFPKLATYPAADGLAAGQGHRYVAGHDLLLDVPQTVANGGVIEGAKHAGHILLTDFPTKAGIPIPGFSESGLGHLLEQVGIHRGWLQINLCEAGLGVLAIAEGSPDLVQAIHGTLSMNVGTFFDTFVEGGIEVGVGIAVWPENPLLLAGGIENIAAGFISAWNTFVVHVDPFLFLGSAATSAIIGFAVASGIVRSSLGNATIAGIRSGVVGSMFAVSPAFGFGVLAGFVIYTLGGKLAAIHESKMQATLSVDDASYRNLIQELCRGNAHLNDFIEQATPRLTFLDRPAMLASECPELQYQPRILGANLPCLRDCYDVLFSDSPSSFDMEHSIFPTDHHE